MAKRPVWPPGPGTVVISGEMRDGYEPPSASMRTPDAETSEPQSAETTEAGS